MNDYDKRLREIEDSESHYYWRCPFDSLECNRVVTGLRFGVCYDEILGLTCPRFDEKVDVFRCHDGLPCNKYAEGFGFGACRDENFGVSCVFVVQDLLVVLFRVV